MKKTKGFPFTAGIALAMAFTFLCPAAFADDALAYHNKGREAFEKKEYDQAISDFTQAIRLNPNFFKAYTNRGLAYQQKGDYNKAISDFTQAIRLNPNFGTAYGSRGYAYALKGEYYIKMDDWESALRHYNNAADDLYSAMRIDPSLEAAPAIKKLLEEVESSIVILKWKAQSKGGNVQEKTAPPPVQQTAPPPTSPKDAAEAAYKRGRAADKNKNYDLAVKEFTEAIRLAPNGSDDYYFHRAKVYVLYLKNYDAAIADVNNALRLKADPESYFLRGVAYHAKGDYAKAVADFEKSLQLDPDSDEVKEALASARQKAGLGGASPTPTITTFTDRRDGKVYKKVKIGSQTWMAQNLNNAAEGSKCYENNAGNCDKYGRLYDWNTAMKACPAGWHLATDAEWTALVNYAGGESTAGTKLKSSTGWDSESGVPTGTDNYGFSALPGGVRFSGYGFYGAGLNGYWWSATEGYADNAWSREMDFKNGNVKRVDGLKTHLWSVRCVQDGP